MNDLKFAIRQLIKNPGFTAVAVLTLALGIGANSAMFSVVYSVLLKPLPLPEPEQIVQIWESPRGQGTTSVAWPKFLDWKRQSTSFEAMTACNWGDTFALTGGERSEIVAGRTVSPEFFSVLKVQPALGRAFQPEDSQPGSSRVAIIGHDLWKTRFDSDPAAVGKTIQLDLNDYTVVGVLPPDFRMSNKGQVYLPQIEAGDLLTNRTSHAHQVLGRLKPGVSLEQAQAELHTISARLEAEFPNTDKDWRTRIVPLRTQLTGNIRQPLMVLMGTVGIVLLIACANIANLLLARAAARRKEMALRAALGAGRYRLARQLVTESVLLSLLGGALGVILAHEIITLIRFLRPDLEGISPGLISMPMPLELNYVVLGFTAAVSVAAGILFGLAPVVTTMRTDLCEGLKQGERGSSHGKGFGQARNIFATAQMALAFILLIGAGLMVKSFRELMREEAGFQTVNLLTAPVYPLDAKFPEPPRRAELFNQLAERLRALPGVTAVAGTMGLPLDGNDPSTSVKVHGRPPLPEGLNSTGYQIVTPGYFEIMGIPLLRGRDFNERDTTNAPLAVVINETFARRIFPGEDPVGRILGLGDGWYRDGDFAPREIIGVVADIRQAGLNQEPTPHVFIPHSQTRWQIGLNMVFRTSVRPATLITPIRESLWAAEKDCIVGEFKSMEQVVSQWIAPQRFSTGLLGGFAALALLLAAIGIYGVLAYSVAQRTREIGLRMALGAQRNEVMGMIVRQGMKLAAIALIIGGAGALATTRFLQNMLYGVTPTDPITFAAIAAVLGSVTLLACWLPARRAARVEPLVALRSE